MTLDPREPPPPKQVTTTIASIAKYPLSLPKHIPRPRCNTQAGLISLVTDDNTTPTPSLSPRHPLAYASSSGSLTDTPTKHTRKISTTISKGDVKKWIETGTFGQKTPEDVGKGEEMHIVCMRKGNVVAGQCAERASSDKPREEVEDENNPVVSNAQGLLKEV